MQSKSSHSHVNGSKDAILLLNIQGFTPDASSAQYWKQDYLSNFILTSEVFYPIIALTETWLKPYNSDAQIFIKGYNVLRSDRKRRTRGGVLLYIYETIPVTFSDTYDDDICQAIIIKSSPIDMIVASIYKPCDAPDSSFTGMLNFLQLFINNTEDADKYTVIILGDFNFPDLWKVNSVTPVPITDGEKNLINFTNTNYLCQYIDVATRQNNILELMLCNNDRLVQHVSSEKHKISDHNIVEIMIPHSDLFPKDVPSENGKDKSLHGFNALNLLKADFSKISSQLQELDWDEVWNNSNLEDFPALFQEIVLDVCKKNCPLKSDCRNKSQVAHRKSYHKILRKKRKLNTRLKCLLELNPSSPKIRHIEETLEQLHNDLKEVSYSNQLKNEQKAVQNIKSNPKFFYSYAKCLAKTKCGISQLFKGKYEVITDRKGIADTLQSQFCSAFSDPNDIEKKIPDPVPPLTSLPSIDFDSEDFIEAIEEISANSSCPDFSIPAIILKNCKYELVKPLKC